MKISARNCIEGKVVAIHDGPVSTEVTVETPAGERIVSSITTTSAKALGLKGAKAYAVIKASNVVRTTYASFTGDSLEDFRPQLH